MLVDALVSFQTSPLSLVAGAGVDVASGIIDLLGLGVGVAPDNYIGNRDVFGSDPGIGWPRAQAQVMITTALTTATAATVNFAYQGAADLGDPTYLPDTWHTIVESGEIAVTDMDTIGDIAWQFDFEPTHPLSFMPRFLRVLAQIPAGTSLTAGGIVIPVTTGLDQQKQRYTPSNYTVSVP